MHAFRTCIFTGAFAALLISGCSDPRINGDTREHVPQFLPGNMVSNYDWSRTRSVQIQFVTRQDQKIRLRALNGEVLFQGFLETGVLSELTLSLPQEIVHVLLEYGEEQESIYIEKETLRLSL